MIKKLCALFLLAGCVGTNWVAPENFTYVPVDSGTYEIATWQKIDNPSNPKIHIYIEGDGNSFEAYGQPTTDPTPRGTLVRDLATQDKFENVVYVARPCQFIMDKNCSETDWTNGRFSKKIIDAQSQVINKIGKGKKITLIGYSGGAMVSGLIIKANKNLNIEKWITVAGVLDHAKWTRYFDDEPLDNSLNMEDLPNVPQIHFVGENDEIVPYELAKTWAKETDIKIVPDAKHNDFGDLNIFKK